MDFSLEVCLSSLAGVLELVKGIEVGVEGVHLSLLGDHHVVKLSVHLIDLALEVLFQILLSLAGGSFQLEQACLVLGDLGFLFVELVLKGARNDQFVLVVLDYKLLDLLLFLVTGVRANSLTVL